jgi:tyrosine-protein phosphatase YwqE
VSASRLAGQQGSAILPLIHVEAQLVENAIATHAASTAHSADIRLIGHRN